MFERGNESREHHSAKLEVYDLLSRHKCILAASIETLDGFRTYYIDIGFAEPVVECTYPIIHAGWSGDDYYAEYGRYPEMIFDIGLVWDNKVIGCVEVMKSHWIDERKRDKFYRAGIFCLGVTSKTGEWLRDHCLFDVRQLILPRAVANRVSYDRSEAA